MAQRVQLVCDLDENEAAGTTRLAVDNRHYRLDLCEEHANHLAGTLAPFLDVATRDTGNGQPKPRASRNGQAKQIRQWARDNGIQIPDRGRIPADIVQQYQATR